MLLGLASFAIALISLIVAILTFIFGGKEGRIILRLTLGGVMIIFTILFGFVGFYSFTQINSSGALPITQVVIVVTATSQLQPAATATVPTQRSAPTIIVATATISNTQTQPPSTATPRPPTPTSTKVPPTQQLTSTTQTRVIPPTLLAPTPTITQGDGPFREHKIASIGTGALSKVTFSDGLASYNQDSLNTYHQRIQLINPDTTTNGCGAAFYNVTKVWFGTASRATITINGATVAIAETSAAGSHGYVVDWTLRINDMICITPIPQGGFHFDFGPDIYYHYDSYCYRGYC